VCVCACVRVCARAPCSLALWVRGCVCGVCRECVPCMYVQPVSTPKTTQARKHSLDAPRVVCGKMLPKRLMHSHTATAGRGPGATRGPPCAAAARSCRVQRRHRRKADPAMLGCPLTVRACPVRSLRLPPSCCRPPHRSTHGRSEQHQALASGTNHGLSSIIFHSDDDSPSFGLLC